MCCFYIFETCAVEAGRWILRNTRVLRSTVALASVQTGQHYPEHLRRIRFKKAETGKTLVFLEKPAHAARCHHLRAPQEALAGRVILRMDQVPRIKRSYRTSENACMDGAQDAS